MTMQFEVGRTYWTRSACDYNTIFSFKIVARTAKRITFMDCGKRVTRGVYVYDGTENCKPLGTYSMCPVISAGRSKP
jgi:hypothetical protein